MGRPIPTFHGFAGQTPLVAFLKKLIDGARAKNLPMVHTLLQGRSGLGKTALAKAIAAHMDTTFHPFSASKEVARYQLALHLAKVNKDDIVFIDEVHALRDGVQELLFPAIDERQVPVVENDQILENEFMKVPPFTLVVATDQPGRLKNALLQRLPLRCTLTRYEDAEMRGIVGNMASAMDLSLAPQAITRLVAAARGVPRAARHLLKSMQLCVPDSHEEITKVQVSAFLKEAGIDGDDLTLDARAFLSYLAICKEPVRLSLIAQKLGLDETTIKTHIESELAHRGLVGITNQGRHLTAAGKNYVQQQGLTK